jgi:hypothetical protein
MTIHWKALEEHFQMVPLVFFYSARGRMHFLKARGHNIPHETEEQKPSYAAQLLSWNWKTTIFKCSITY